MANPWESQIAKKRSQIVDHERRATAVENHETTPHEPSELEAALTMTSVAALLAGLVLLPLWLFLICCGAAVVFGLIIGLRMADATHPPLDPKIDLDIILKELPHQPPVDRTKSRWRSRDSLIAEDDLGFVSRTHLGRLEIRNDRPENN
jgi:hypothetical protein